ncbi:hypothetical protein [Brazilian marseillevirus]|uniref:hypothetical protein n=1 Tax=Brazilian marseillevirus TaxID=1813599 RepID=UPI00078257BB|nr:hypothetical protein A3303_gp375 [Brazilian marseillevirus]AMQ10883.1 hypothetical protein [Brazilian marseillevirus]
MEELVACELCDLCPSFKLSNVFFVGFYHLDRRKPRMLPFLDIPAPTRANVENCLHILWNAEKALFQLVVVLSRKDQRISSQSLQRNSTKDVTPNGKHSLDIVWHVLVCSDAMRNKNRLFQVKAKLKNFPLKVMARMRLDKLFGKDDGSGYAFRGSPLKL